MNLQDLSGSNDSIGKYKRESVMFVKICICSSKYLLHKLRLATFCRNFLEKLERSVLGIVYFKKD